MLHVIRAAMLLLLLIFFSHLASKTRVFAVAVLCVIAVAWERFRCSLIKKSINDLSRAVYRGNERFSSAVVCARNLV